MKQQTATLYRANLTNFCPITNQYKCSDGSYLLVTLPSMDVAGTLTSLGFIMPILETHLPSEVDVFLCTEDGEIIDFDGDPTNGMTTVNSFETTSHEEALRHVGYKLV